VNFILELFLSEEATLFIFNHRQLPVSDLLIIGSDTYHFQAKNRCFLKFTHHLVFKTVFKLKPVMLRLNEDTIEKFIRENRDKFGVYRPPDNHLQKFLFKLNYRISHIINIVPYLIKVAVVTVLIFVASIVIWDNYLRKDRYEITLGNKISLIFFKR
jgi:hypothetical protein